MTDEEKGSLNAKIMGGLLLAAAIGVGYLVFGGKKKESNLGDLNTAKTKILRTAQRKAVFARLDEEGSVYPKNTKGVRKPRKKKK